MLDVFASVMHLFLELLASFDAIQSKRISVRINDFYICSYIFRTSLTPCLLLSLPQQQS